MKIGIRLLLLVALLLPFRGAMAVAGVLCHADLGTGAVLTTLGPHDVHEAGGHAHDDNAGGHSEHDQGSAPTSPPCDFCSAICAAPPLPVSTVGVPALLPSGAERFPALSPPRSTATFGAPERPPRAA